jgi:hypothetical protein
MKRKLLIPLAAVAITAMIATQGCGDSGKTTDVTKGLDNCSKIEFVEFSDTTILDIPSFTAAFGKPSYGTVSASGIFPVSLGGADIRELQDSIMSVAFGNVAPTIAEAFAKYVAAADFGDEEEPTALKPAKLPLATDSTMSDITTTISVKSLTADFAAFAVDIFSYSHGAAHGYYGVNYVNYYIPQRKVLTADNIFDSKYRAELLTIISQAATDQYSVVDTSVDASAIESFKNFYVEPGSITFVYQPYEIAPFAAGIISVKVDTYLIYDYLSPLGKEIFGM